MGCPKLCPCFGTVCAKGVRRKIKPDEMITFLGYTPAQLAHKGPRVVHRRLTRAWQSVRDQRMTTYAPDVPDGALNAYLPPLSGALSPAHHPALAAIGRAFVRGCFDVLGTGWVAVRHGMACMGLEGHRYDPVPAPAVDPDGAWLEGRINPANLAGAQAIWQAVDPGYVPIDWHLDFKSGYRWAEATPAHQVTYGHHPGVDVKVPWELGRMHHHPQLALAYGVARTGVPGFEAPDVYRRAFRNQVLDFLATNPPHFGIHWHTAMLAGIRAANWVVAYDLFRAEGAVFDPPFERVFKRSLLEHGRWILKTLEWWDFDERNNHYLANIVGLLFLAAYLPANEETDAWLAFAYRELIREVEWQFNPDGSSFEGSTGYHAFSAEMVGWAVALISALPAARRAALRARPRGYLPRSAARRAFRRKAHTPSGAGDPFPPEFHRRMDRIRAFLEDVRHPDGRLIQVGDNDSGRFLKLMPRYHRLTPDAVRERYANLSHYVLPGALTEYRDEDLLHYDATLAVLGADVPEESEAAVTATAVRALRGEFLCRECNGEERDAGGQGDLAAWRALVAELPESHRAVCFFPAKAPEYRSGLQFCVYPDFGAFRYVARDLSMIIRCGPAARKSAVIHPHEDQLSMDLWLEGRAVVTDPGTYVYTPLLARREAYRGAGAHFSPRLRQEGGESVRAGGAFALPEWNPAHCDAAGPEGFVGHHDRPAGRIYRMVELLPGGIRVTDFTPAGSSALPADPAGTLQRMLPVTLGYGKLTTGGEGD